MSKPKLAYVHLAACSGCEISFLDNFERLLDMMDMVDVEYMTLVDAFVPGSPPGPGMAYNIIRAVAEGDLDYLKYLSSYEVGGYACGCDLWKDIVENSLCIGCGACAMACPTRAITMVLGRPNVVFDRCVKCGACYAQCPRSFLPTDAINRFMDKLMEE